MDFVWDDGGRAAGGYVGLTGDCVTRSIAIATGVVYRDIYQGLSEASDKTARHGITSDVSANLLLGRGWKMVSAYRALPEDLPRGALIVQFESEGWTRSGHMSCMIDHTVYDTWDPTEDPSCFIVNYWVNESASSDSSSLVVAPSRRRSNDQGDLTQREFDSILNRVKALHRTSANDASTEGEVRNALRMMQNLMLRHNLSRSDITEDDDASHVGMTRRACPLNGRRAYQWETMLAHYMTTEIFPMVQYYIDRHGHRTLFWFYGPVEDVEQTIELFREILLTIVTAARVKYGGYTRGSAASYAEGYVQGLPRSHRCDSGDDAILSEEALIHARTLAIHSEARHWLDVECDIRLHTSRGSGRSRFDPSAHSEGQKDGAKHGVPSPYSRKRITRQP